MVFTKMRRRMVLLLSIGGLINHVDRSALSVLPQPAIPGTVSFR